MQAAKAEHAGEVVRSRVLRFKPITVAQRKIVEEICRKHCVLVPGKR